MLKARYAILLDGGFVTKKLFEKNKRVATAEDITDLCGDLQKSDQLKDYELLRVYYYDAWPSDESTSMPVSKQRHNLSGTPRYKQSQSLYDQLVMKPGFALRMGETKLSPDGWKLRPRALKDLKRQPRALTDADFGLDISQKGVDLRIGLDMARLALRELACAIVVVTGDSDFVPAFKFVRREGVKVLLATLGHKGVRQELKAHSDFVLS
ncbi:MAG: NYN domain-containing protein [Alphaproteobacteria bacterium]|nr:NYN domain-containing protein [Alphaproteobacteria bacterium]